MAAMAQSRRKVRKMKENGTRHSKGGDRTAVSRPPTLPDLGITRESSKWLPAT